MKIGVVGYSDDKCFDHTIAKALLASGLEIVRKMHPAENYVLISGLTNTGIPKLAYEMADHMGWKTVGLTAKEGEQYECYPVDQKIIIGEKFGSESIAFVQYIDCLVRVGGGNQSMKETKMAKDRGIPVYEYDLPRHG